MQLSPDGIQRDDTHCTTCGDCTDACPAEARSWIGKPLSVAEVLQVVEKDRLYYEDSGGGVTFSGGEPLAQTEFLLEALQACGERELHRAVDTSGLAKTEDLIRVAQHTDLFLFDLKLMNDYLHRQATGVSNRRIIENLHALNEMHPSVRVRVPVIPGINDDIDNFVAMADLLATLEHVRRVDLLPYHSSAREKHNKFGIPWKMNGATGHTQDQLEELAHVIRRPGLQVTIEG